MHGSLQAAPVVNACATSADSKPVRAELPAEKAMTVASAAASLAAMQCWRKLL